MKKFTLARPLFVFRFLAVVAFAMTTAMGQSAFAQAPSSQERAILRPGANSDTRIAVQNTLVYPFSTVARLVSTFPNGDQSVGSGAFVGPNRLVTAGHNLYDHKAGGYAKTVEVIPAYFNGSAPFGKTHSTFMMTSKGYMENGDPNFDFGLLTTADALGWKTGWLGLKQTENVDLGTVVLCGYPNDLGRTHIMYYAGGSSQWETRRNRWETTHRLQYEFWTDSGMSGGPLINYSFYVVGIHTGGNSQYNYAVSVAPAFLTWKLK